MSHWFIAGGFVMWFTLPIGLLAVATAAKYALEPNRRYVPLVITLGTMTLLSGGFGLVSGLIKSLRAITQVQPAERWIWLVGLGESLVNVAMALALVAIATAAMVIGTWRLSRQPAAG